MPALPRHIAAVLSALKLKGGHPEELRALSDQEWENLLSYTDSAHMTLHLAYVCRSYFPQWVDERTAHNLSDNSQRFERIKRAYQDLAHAFRGPGVEYIVLKGFSHWPGYVENPRLRLQSDIDLFCPRQSIGKALEILNSLGYRAAPTGMFTDHLPIMIRSSGWKWKGNLYDPEIPAHVEIHHQLWGRDRARFGPFTDDFWRRRSTRQVEDLTFPTLNWVDTLSFAALQVLRDLLNHGLSTHKVYELARFLHMNANDPVFWRDWKNLHEPVARRAEAVAFRLAVECFGCDVHPIVAQEIEMLPTPMRRWMREYSTSALNPVENMNKDAVWLHIALIQSLRDKLAVFFRELIPTKLKVDPDTTSVTDDGELNAHALRSVRYVSYALTRIPFHAMLIPITLWHGLRLYIPRRRTGETPLMDGL